MKKTGKKRKIALWAVLAALVLAAGSTSPKNEQADVTTETVRQADTTTETVRQEDVTTETAQQTEEQKTDEHQPTPEQQQTEEEESELQDALLTEGTMEVHFIDVGQGDSTLILCNGHALLIDAGSSDKGTTIQLYLKKQNVSSLDAVIWTHPDADHIGGADVITTKYDIGTIYMPAVSAQTSAYEELMNAIAWKNYSITTPAVGSSFDLGGATVTFLGPGKVYDDDNDNSLVCMVQFGENRFLFTGDAQEDAENTLVEDTADLSADVYKAGHHGSRNASSSQLLKAVMPGAAVISCGQDNSYGHPHGEVLNRFRELGIDVFRTDEQGTIVAISDGTNITWNAAPSTTWKAGEATEHSESTETSTQNSKYGTAPEGAVYIGNKSNHKLHTASCSGLPQSRNQVLFDTLDAAAEAGYTKDMQCKRCYPYGK